MEIDEIQAADGDRRHPARVVWITSSNPEWRTVSGVRKMLRRECGRLNSSDTNEFTRVPMSLDSSQNLSGYLISARVKYEYGDAVRPFMFGKGRDLVQWSYATLRAMPDDSVTNPLTLAATRVGYRPVTCSLD